MVTRGAVCNSLARTTTVGELNRTVADDIQPKRTPVLLQSRSADSRVAVRLSAHGAPAQKDRCVTSVTLEPASLGSIPHQICDRALNLLPFWAKRWLAPVRHFCESRRHKLYAGRVAELADAKDLGSFGAILAGSTPVAPTIGPGVENAFGWMKNWK